MKKYALTFSAALAGSLMTALLFKFWLMGDSQTTNYRIEHVDHTPIYGAGYSAPLTLNEENELVPLDFTVAAEKVMEAVVHIKSTQTVAAQGPRNQGRDPFRDFFGDEFFEHFFGPRQFDRGPRGPQARVGTGSGVIINKEGYIVTNNHVIADADDIEVTLYDNRSLKAKVIGTDPSTDLAVIKVDEKDLPKLTMANSDQVKVGEWVLAVGNPFNLNSTVTAGIVSAKARNINILRQSGASNVIESFIQTDAAINPGNSGGALVNLEGNLIGINTAIASPTGAYAGYGFAVPSNIAAKVVEDLIEFGVVQRAFLGIFIQDVNSTLVKDKKLKVNQGVYVDSLMANSAAAEAGLQKGDVVLAINGNRINTVAELQESIAPRRPGDKVNMEVDRKGKRQSLSVELKNSEGTSEFIARKEGKAGVFEMLGAELSTLDKSTARKLDLPGGVKIEKLSTGKLSKYTDIKEGFIITKVDNQVVKSVEDLEKILAGKSGGILIEGRYESVPGNYYYGLGL